MKKKKKEIFIRENNYLYSVQQTTTIINVSDKISRNEAIHFKNSFVTV